MSAFTILFQTKWVYFSSLATSSRKNCRGCIMNHYCFVLLNSWNDLWPRTYCSRAEPGRGYFLHALPYGQGSSVYQCTAKHLCDKKVMRCNLLQRKRRKLLVMYSQHSYLANCVTWEKSSYFLAIKTNTSVTLGALNCSKSPRRSGKILIYRYQVLSLPATPKSLTWHAQQGERCKQFPELLDFQMRAGETGSLLPRQFVRKPPICDLSK